MFKLGDKVAHRANGRLGEVIDVDPDNGDLIVEYRSLVTCRCDAARFVERASPLRHWSMRAHAFYLRMRDCGFAYALTWPN
jgi:heat shock protein HspQ